MSFVLHFLFWVSIFAFLPLNYAREEDSILLENNHPLSFIQIEEYRFNDQNRILTSGPSQFRIQALYDPFDAAPNTYKIYIETQLLPAVIDYFQSALRLKYPLLDNLKLPTTITTICGFQTPPILHQQGIDTDFLILINSEADESGNWIASSGACYLSSRSSRPLIARSVLNRNLLNEPKGNYLVHERNIYTLFHEFIHALGFSKRLFEYYLDDKGIRMKGHVKETSNRTFIDVPFLSQSLQDFFGCPLLEGLYLENNGGNGSEGSHLEKRYFLYEVMASGIMYGQRISEFSLGILEATGWYSPDYSFSEPYFFGKGQGCQFLKDSCYVNNFQFDEFCVGSKMGCAAHGRGGGSCKTDSRSEGCKYISPKIEYDCENAEGVHFA